MRKTRGPRNAGPELQVWRKVWRKVWVSESAETYCWGRSVHDNNIMSKWQTGQTHQAGIQNICRPHGCFKSLCLYLVLIRPMLLLFFQPDSSTIDSNKTISSNKKEKQSCWYHSVRNVKKVDGDYDKSWVKTFEYDFADRHTSELLTLELIKLLSCVCVPACLPFSACVRCWLCAFMVCRQTYHRTVSQSRIQKIAVQISVFHIGQDDHRGGVSFALHCLQTHTCTNTTAQYNTHTLHTGLSANYKNTPATSNFQFTSV